MGEYRQYHFSAIVEGLIMIPIVLEDTEILKMWGLGVEKIIENCRFCSTPTRYWHKETNTPVCQVCAEKFEVKDLIPCAVSTGLPLGTERE